MLKNKFRIVRDNYEGFEAQVKFWWLPIIWLQMRECGKITNTHSSIESAENFIKSQAKNREVVKHVNID